MILVYVESKKPIDSQNIQSKIVIFTIDATKIVQHDSNPDNDSPPFCAGTGLC